MAVMKMSRHQPNVNLIYSADFTALLFSAVSNLRGFDWNSQSWLNEDFGGPECRTHL
jgi:hypothetical protein